ncbi:transmembrane protein like protein [Ditylenchus destructor]|uniref:Transmembrane protein like protein n=1 Tax=Ditylenchus destructor TaxID=166010 RepID=A0AAD4N776_9BILA|nr:transmembrane protein like protein [Ditylenchus destructor]
MSDLVRNYVNPIIDLFRKPPDTSYPSSGRTGVMTTHSTSTMPSSCCGRSRADLWGFRPGTSCRRWVQIAGFSAGTAVLMAAYGRHVIASEEWRIDERRKKAFEDGSKHHLIQSLGLLCAHKARYPFVTAALFSSGIIMFCGPCYAYSIWNEDRLRKLTPIGGLMFILAWFSFML